MKKLIIVSILALASLRIHAQILHPVKWSYAAKKLNNIEAVLYLKADIEDGWHIYSTMQPDGGPIKTSFVFMTSSGYNLSGNVIEPKPVTKYEKTFGMDVSYFEHSAIFQQKIKLKRTNQFITGVLEFMVCNDKQCLPPEKVSFKIPIK